VTGQAPAGRHRADGHGAADALTRAFAATDHALLGGCLPAGYPTLHESANLLAVVAEECDLLEIAAPTRHPAMDGPAMSHAHATAIGNGYHTNHLFELIRRTAPSGTPVVVVAYWHTINPHGPARFAADLAHAGATGAVLPDIPPGALPAWQRAAQQHGLHTVRVAPADAP
jgi:tryptophan synthase alpha chain